MADITGSLYGLYREVVEAAFQALLKPTLRLMCTITSPEDVREVPSVDPHAV